MKPPSTYPGSFQPPIPNRLLRNQNQFAHTVPPWAIDRVPGMLLVRCWLPGILREDIDLYIRNKRVFLSVLSTLPAQSPGTTIPIRYTHQFPLPPDADPLFVSAEFSRGMLTLRIPLVTELEEATPTDVQVVVY